MRFLFFQQTNLLYGKENVDPVTIICDEVHKKLEIAVFPRLGNTELVVVNISDTNPPF